MVTTIEGEEVNDNISSLAQPSKGASSGQSHKVANNPWAQGIFDCREILLPRGSGKGGQRRRADLRAILFTIASEGERNHTPQGRDNGLWWTTERIASTNGIGIHQTEDHINWLVNVGIVQRLRRFNQTSILWVDSRRLREIVKRQQDDRHRYQLDIVSQRDAGLIKDSDKFPQFDPPDLEARYFTKESPSEAPIEALSEAKEEAHTERPSESSGVPYSEYWNGRFDEPPF